MVFDPDGIILNNTAGTIQLASTLTDPMIQNISTIVTLTNEQKTEKYSNDLRSDLDLSAILSTSLALSPTSIAISNYFQQQSISTNPIRNDILVFDYVAASVHLFTYTTTITDNHSAAQIDINKELMW